MEWVTDKEEVRRKPYCTPTVFLLGGATTVHRASTSRLCRLLATSL